MPLAIPELPPAPPGALLALKRRPRIGTKIASGAAVSSFPRGWVMNPREDLVKLYTTLNKPEQAKRFQSELGR
jgi:hypothetical protein